MRNAGTAQNKMGSLDGYLRTYDDASGIAGFPHGYDGSAPVNTEKFIEGMKRKVVPILYSDTVNIYFEDAEKNVWDYKYSRKSKKRLKIEYCASHIRHRALTEQAKETDVLTWMREYSEELELEDTFREQLNYLYDEIEKIFNKDLKQAEEYLN